MPANKFPNGLGATCKCRSCAPSIHLHFPYLQDGNESNYSYSEPLSDTDNYIDNKRAAKLEAEKHAYIQLEKAQVSETQLNCISIESAYFYTPWPLFASFTPLYSFVAVKERGFCGSYKCII